MGAVRIADGIRASSSLLAAGLPLLERSFEVLPVARRVREDVLPAAVIATLLCVVAGYATSRNSVSGLAVGWSALVLFLGVVVAMFGFADLIPRWGRALYILSFALFGLSAAAFLSIRHEAGNEMPARMSRW
jgi:hypothetical protein